MGKRLFNIGHRFAPVALLFTITLRGSVFNPQGANLTVTSDTLQVSFSGADVVGIVNALTGETHLRNPSSRTQLNLTLTKVPTSGLTALGAWTMNPDGASARLSFSDSVRTVSMVIRVDPVTQEIVVNLDGTANQGGVEGLIWGATGFDMTVGKFILPAQGGLAINGASLTARNTYTFGHSQWQAPLALFQGVQGGVAIYSTDTNSLCKNVTVAVNQQQTTNALFQVEAPAPWNTAIEAGPIEWRLAAYAGDWQTGARIYRD